MQGLGRARDRSNRWQRVSCPGRGAPRRLRVNSPSARATGCAVGCAFHDPPGGYHVLHVKWHGLLSEGEGAGRRCPPEDTGGVRLSGYLLCEEEAVQESVRSSSIRSSRAQPSGGANIRETSGSTNPLGGRHVLSGSRIGPVLDFCPIANVVSPRLLYSSANAKNTGIELRCLQKFPGIFASTGSARGSSAHR